MNDDNARPCLYVIAKLLWIFDAGNVQYAALTMCRGVMEWWRWPGARNLFPKHCLYMSVYFNFRTKIDINICMNMLGLFLINITVANIFSITDILQLIYFTDCYFIFIYFFVCGNVPKIFAVSRIDPLHMPVNESPEMIVLEIEQVMVKFILW